MSLAALTSIIHAIEPPPQCEPGSVEHILQTIRAHLGMDVAFASHIADGKVTLQHVDANDNAPVARGDVFPAEDGYCQRVIEGRIPYLIPDTAEVAEVAGLRCTKELPVGAHVSVPMRLSDGSVYGTFCCFSGMANRSLNSRDLQMMHAFAELAGAQIEQKLRSNTRIEDILARVRRIIEQDEITIVYQPIYRLADKKIVGVECLSRFADSENRGPDQWFAEAAEAGLGVDLELTALRSALRGMAYLPDDIYVAINVSPAAILSGKVEKALRGVAPGRVLLEVTEHAVVDDYPRLAKALEPLRGHVRLAIDDAGAGYSGLKHILEMRADIIKLDMSLTRGIDADPARYALATALVAFADQIGSQIVAEGVETKAELSALESLGVSFAQGYYLRRPMPMATAAQFLLARRTKDAQGVSAASIS